MDNEQEPLQAPAPGAVYGTIGFWTVITGAVVGTVGLIWYLAGGDCVVPPEALIGELWKGAQVDEIWRNTTGGEAKYGHWYLGSLGKADALALLGVSICAVGAVLGAWGAFISMMLDKEEKVRPRHKIFAVLAAVIAVLLTLSTTGIISMH